MMFSAEDLLTFLPKDPEEVLDPVLTKSYFYKQCQLAARPNLSSFLLLRQVVKEQLS
jgi:hypothetical protein